MCAKVRASFFDNLGCMALRAVGPRGLLAWRATLLRNSRSGKEFAPANFSSGTYEIGGQGGQLPIQVLADQ